MAGHLERYGWDNSFFPRLAYIPSSEPNSGDGDYQINKTGSTYTWSKYSAASPYRTLEWEWNGSDVSQFESSADFIGHAGSGTDLSGVALSVVADGDVPGGNKLRLTASGAGSGPYAVAHWLVLDSESSLTWPGVYEWELIVKGSFAVYGGITFFADPATDHYYGWSCLNNNGTRHRVDAGTVIDFMGGATNAALMNTTDPHRVRIRIHGDHESGSEPRFYIEGESRAFGATIETALEEPNGTWQTSGTTPPSSWQDKDTSRWGLNLVSISGTYANNLDILSLKLFKLGTGLHG